MNAVVAWPGATAQQVQDQVLNRMERELQKIEGIDHVRSFARQGYGGLNFWMKGGTPKHELERAWYLARKKIADVRHEFPEGVRGPFFNDEFTDVYSVLVRLQRARAELARAAGAGGRRQAAAAGRARRDQDRCVRPAGRAGVRGVQQPPAGGAGHQPAGADRARWRGRTRSAPAAAARGRRPRLRARDGPGRQRQLRDARDVADVPIEAGGRLLKLSDVARVHSGLEDPPQFTARHNGQPVLMLGVTFERSGNILKLGAALDERMARCRPRCRWA
jgi:multidrug efflux pump